MSKILISFILLVSFLNAADKKSNWTHQYTYKLKKDEVAVIGINASGVEKDKFFFRWTSIIKDRVTTLVNHQGYPHQYILYKKRSLDRAKFYLLPDGSNRIENRTYLLLVLSDIDKGNKEVSFDIFIKDNKSRILVDFGEKNEK
ncbi:hypothetical protein [Sulfurospirillum arcachonense]|uniref:hypothetical protein n=1 Tax=Sulfurospirillum arcachonense TaxID=57666 RepID=UPI000469D24E|nr:hypothetical protein [Sulfurospirillum arcachonense]